MSSYSDNAKKLQHRESQLVLEARTTECFVKLERLILPFSPSKIEISSDILSSKPTKCVPARKSKVQCPECPKELASRNGLKKHLLSHRPKDQWPFQCQFCGQHFQAKGDAPKHWQTQKHKNDPRIPKIGTAEWKKALNDTVKLKFEKTQETVLQGSV